MMVTLMRWPGRARIVHGESKLPQSVASVTTLAMYPLGVSIGAGAAIRQSEPSGVITVKRSMTHRILLVVAIVHN